MLIDLTFPFSENIPVWPGDPKPSIKKIAEIGKEGWNEKRLEFNSHCGTHMDAPFHMLKNGRKLDELPLEKFEGNAVLVESNSKEISEEEFRQAKVREGMFVVVKTLQAWKFVHGLKGKKSYFEEAPFISREAAEFLAAKKIRSLCLDFASPDISPYEVHKILLEKEILIIENLLIPKEFKEKKFNLTAFPILLKEADGAPCRVIARI